MSVTFSVTQGIQNFICTSFSLLFTCWPPICFDDQISCPKLYVISKIKQILNVRTSSKTRFSTPSRANILVTPGLQKLQEVGFNASPGLKQIYNWSFIHLLPRKFKISSFLKLETFCPLCGIDTQLRKNDQIWSFSMEPSCKSSVVTPNVFFVFRICSTISHSCRSLKKFWTLEVFATNVLKYWPIALHASRDTFRSWGVGA